LAEYAERYEDKPRQPVEVNPWRVIKNARVDKSKVVVDELSRVVTFLRNEDFFKVMREYLNVSAALEATAVNAYGWEWRRSEIHGL
jgi:hypothetical protein